MKKSLCKGLVIAVVGSFMVAGVASAALISGDISISGGFDVLEDGNSLADAIGIDFSDDMFVVNGVETGSVLDSYIDAWETGTINDFYFTDVTGDGKVLWEVNGVTFTLTTLTVGEQDSTSLFLSGTGYFSYSGYEDTYGEWALSGQTTDASTTLSWSFTSDASVPEPATMLLFGTGMAGLASMNRRKRY
ncbi:PEP-CTERM sorting domain-containing protein [Desulfosediminicola flagellatus]|uniref:PEP-CTERM sorting domain-containing protein n=1 Tax=Desulfosediminicola flagellatus TaxID=2569541 RepID=UPI001E421F0A|nr:PEP-CTERM sorting domain-containing protein [Desulfosediminicola flagellatus]